VKTWGSQIKRVVLWIPTIIVHLWMMFSYYVYNMVIVAKLVESPHIKAIMTILYHGILTMAFWSYWKTNLTVPQKMPEAFKLSALELRELAEEEVPQSVLNRNLPIKTRTKSGKLRFCARCRAVKPDRAHHCSMCGCCVMKMDHHCPWVNNCVGHHNYKAFCLFLFWCLMYLILLITASLNWFTVIFEGGPKAKALPKESAEIPLMFFIAVAFSLSVFGLFGFHTYLLTSNRTTIESWSKQNFIRESVKGFDLGSFQNFKQVFGSNPWKWLVPTGRPIGNGVHYPVQYVNGELSDGLDTIVNGGRGDLIANNSDDLFETTDADDDDYHERGSGAGSISGHEAMRLLREPLNR